MVKKKLYNFQESVYPVGKDRSERLWTRFPLDNDPFHPLRVFVEKEIGDFVETYEHGITEFWPVYGKRKRSKHSK